MYLRNPKIGMKILLSFGASADSTTAVAPSLMSLHVASYAEGLSTARVWAFKRLLSSMRMAVDLETRGP